MWRWLTPFAGTGHDRAEPVRGLCVICHETAASSPQGQPAPGGRPPCRNAGDWTKPVKAARGADVYVTLEPCFPIRRDTPPPRLAPPRLSGAGVARVFVACTDPDSCAFPTRHRHAARSRDRGDRRWCARREGGGINAGFFSRVTHRPAARPAGPAPQYLRCRSMVPGPQEESIDAALQRLGREGKTRVRLAK